jgi:hypothetical protein
MGRTLGITGVAAMMLGSGVHPAAAQAWVPPGRTGAVTFVAQTIDHVGRMRDDGTRAAVGKAINVGLGVEVDYAFTDRWSVSANLPYIFSKFTDPGGPPFGLPFPDVDACRCWNNAFADVGVTARYNLVNRDNAFVVTPFVAAGVPSHAYDYVGEAVVGRRLTELMVGAHAGQRLDAWTDGLSVQAGYRYTMVKQVLEIPNNRSNGLVTAGVVLPRRVLVFPRGFSTRVIISWQRTHGGLRFPADVIDERFPGRRIEFHRMLRDNYLHVGAGVSYSIGAWDMSGSALVTARGSNSHDVHVFSLTIGRLFEIGGQ